MIPTGEYCTACKNTGKVIRTYGFAPGLAQEYRDAILQLATLTQSYKQYLKKQDDEAREVQREAAMAQQRQRLLEEAARQEAIRVKKTSADEACLEEVKTIEDKLTKLVENGTPEVQEIRERWNVQLQYMLDYWKQSKTKFLVAKHYEDYPPVLQWAQAKYEYYHSLQSKGFATIAGQNVNALSFEDLSSRIQLRNFSGNYKPTVDEPQITPR